ncbi:SDR family NAD(P)-dependent oxidoreductase [Clostridium grantii]|uniref:Short-chain dehydrogenase n=1 Tax=Clostridium grantii DSM 8605 TaxID=1121316 RepID=A0A1M5WAF4_9CLOT|nr:SDR family oxidoreductase [Clostridium grantii]SHH84466.1 Short-chain dehydrogenase [Clostridium grantii DSM 8605]
MKNLKGKKALITGSSRGIGKQIAIGLATLGCDIILHARTLENLKEIEEILKKYDIKVYKIACELSDPNSVQLMLEELDMKHKNIDIVYNNAAISCENQLLFNTQRKVWDEIFEVNLFALIKICEHFLPLMIENKYGRIINFSSGISNQPEMAPYAVSKAAVNKYTEDMAIRLKGTNVLMNLINPGWVQTDMGGANASSSIESVLPGVIVPALLDDNGECGKTFNIWEYKNLELPKLVV